MLVSGNHKGAHEVVVVGFDSATPTRRVFTENNLSNERYVVSSPIINYSLTIVMMISMLVDLVTKW